MGTGDRCRVPPAVVRHRRRPGNVQGRYRVGIVEGSSGINIEENFFYREIWDTIRGGLHVA